MRALASVAFGLAVASCTLLRDYDQLNAGVAPPMDAAPADASPTPDADARGRLDASVVTLGCGNDSCNAAREICCVKFADDRVTGQCLERASDAAAACADLFDPTRLAGVLECDTSAQCAADAVCCGDGQARKANATVFRGRCVSGSTCGSSANELCGPGRQGPGLLAFCRNGATQCERTHDLDVFDDTSEEDAQFPLLKCVAAAE